MIRPTLRAVLIFAAGIPLAVFVVIVDTDFWPLSFNLAALVLVTIGIDALLGLTPRRLDIRVVTPDLLYIGERGSIAVTAKAPGYRRTTRLELIAELRGNVEPAEIARGELAPGEECRVAIPVAPTRRGQVKVDRIWVRWTGPMSLVQFTRQVAVDRTIDVLPNVRGVQGAMLQFFAQEAIYGIKAQRQKGEGSEFEALREYAPGLDTRHIDWKDSAR